MSRHFSATHIFVDNFENRMICYQKRVENTTIAISALIFIVLPINGNFTESQRPSECVVYVLFQWQTKTTTKKNWKRFIFVRPMLYSNCLYNSAIVINSFLLLPSPISLESIISTTFPYIRSLLWLTNIFPFTWFELISFLSEWDTMLSKTNK